MLLKRIDKRRMVSMFFRQFQPTIETFKKPISKHLFRQIIGYTLLKILVERLQRVLK